MTTTNPALKNDPNVTPYIDPEKALEMKLLIIRHGEPIYNPDTLTEKGKREAKILASFLKKYFPEIRDFYVSPLGRAKETAEPILEAFGKEATTFPWLREFGPFPGYVRP